MSRYIDADKVMEEIERIGGHNLCEWETIGVKALIDRQPTADVAPKSEVERLEAEAECFKNANADLALALLYKCEPTKEHLHILEATVREKVAREIFEEIEKLLKANKIYSGFAELKKKYTEKK